MLARPAPRAAARPVRRDGARAAAGEGTACDAVAGAPSSAAIMAVRMSRPGGRVAPVSTRAPRKVRAPYGTVVGKNHPG
jgi:hypothetical protein